MLIKEISEDLTVIIINNNKVPNFPLKKALWKGWNQFLGHLQTLQISQQWRCSAGSPGLAAHLATVDLLLFCFVLICFLILDGTSYRLDFGLPSPLGTRLEGGVSRGKNVLASIFQQPRALPTVGMELPTAFFSYLGGPCRLWNMVTFKRPSGIPSCLKPLQKCHRFHVFL